MNEPTGYRETAERIRNDFNGAELLTLTQAAKVLGMDARTLLKHKPVTLRVMGRGYGVSVNDLALYLTRQTGYKIAR